MSYTDKNKAMITYLSECPAIASNPMFFNFAEAVDGNTQFVTTATDRVVEKPYIDGSVLKQYTVTLIDYSSIVYQALVCDGAHPNLNLEEIQVIQDIIHWVEEQNDNHIYPDFGDMCLVDEISTLTDSPNFNGVDISKTAPLAKYSVAIRVRYLDKSKMIWK